jgi:hypothetical protein
MKKINQEGNMLFSWEVVKEGKQLNGLKFILFFWSEI